MDTLMFYLGSTRITAVSHEYFVSLYSGSEGTSSDSRSASEQRVRIESSCPTMSLNFEVVLPLSFGRLDHGPLSSSTGMSGCFAASKIPHGAKDTIRIRSTAVAGMI
jgi:hypothetical protein